jgi:hypothetical protein
MVEEGRINRVKKRIPGISHLFQNFLYLVALVVFGLTIWWALSR